MELAPSVVEAQGLKRWMAGKPSAGISQVSLLEEAVGSSTLLYFFCRFGSFCKEEFMGLVSTLFSVELEHLWGAAVCPSPPTPATANCRDKKHLESFSHPATPSAKNLSSHFCSPKISFHLCLIIPSDACLVFLESVLSCLLLSKTTPDSSG